MKQNKSPFKWRHYEPTIILLCVRWYCRYQLSYRDLEEMMRERSLPVDHSTVWRWVQRYAPEINNSMAFENGIIDSNPMERVKRLQEPEARQRYLNQCAVDEEERLVQALVPFGEHIIALVELDLEMGMRLGEMLRAAWMDIDWSRRAISITQTKNGKPRVVPLTDRALNILRALRQDAPIDERIFDHKRTGRRRRQLMVCFQRAVRSAGIDDFHFHDLRHTFATRLRAANVHEYDIADLLGHSTTPGDTRNTKVTRGYAHAVPQRLRDAVNNLETGKQAILANPPSVCQRAG